MSEVGVLIVDDSLTVRAVLRRVIDSAPGLRVIGEAEDGLAAVEETLRLGPQAIVMDLDLPGIDGYEATKRIMETCPTPIVVVTSRLRRDVMVGFQALEAGAFDILAKPEVPKEWDGLRRDLLEKLRQAAVGLAVARPASGQAPHAEISGHQLRYLAIGASTGGPGALRRVLSELGRSFPVGVAVVQHIAEGFETGLAEWLAHELKIDVAVARQGELLKPGSVRLAPPGSHLRIDHGGQLKLDRTVAPRRGHRPSVDELFLSLARLCPRNVAAVLLTGMGRDGVAGMLALRQAGALTVTQAESSCAVFGMPRAALKEGATDIALAPAEIGRLLARTIRGEQP